MIPLPPDYADYEQDDEDDDRPGFPWAFAIYGAVIVGLAIALVVVLA